MLTRSEPMFKTRYLNILALSALTLILSACTSAPEPRPGQTTSIDVPQEERPDTKVAVQEEHVDLSQKSQSFHSGMNDGCATAKGKYTKDAEHFKQEADYGEGWFYGRRKCQAH